jgi:hypothetical protein
VSNQATKSCQANNACWQASTAQLAN